MLKDKNREKKNTKKLLKSCQTTKKVLKTRILFLKLVVQIFQFVMTL